MTNKEGSMQKAQKYFLRYEGFPDVIQRRRVNKIVRYLGPRLYEIGFLTLLTISKKILSASSNTRKRKLPVWKILNAQTVLWPEFPMQVMQP